MAALTQLAFTVLKMSGRGLAAALVVLVCWLLLSRLRCSRTALLLLWLVVALRLACPWTPGVPTALARWEPDRLAETVTEFPAGDYQAAFEGTAEFDRAVAAGVRPEESGSGPRVVYFTQNDAEGCAPAPTVGERYGPLLSLLWLAGAALMLACGGGSYLLLKRRLRFAVKDGDEPGVWYSDRISSPCVVGLLRPRIYLTFGLTAGQKAHILVHERAHLRSGDHLWKALAWLLLSLHWFNLPLWAVYRAFVLCLETACDQRVLRQLGGAERSDYGQTLLDLSAGRKFSAAPSPIAFGEGETGGRVKAVLRYKKPLAGLTAAVVALAVVLALTLGAGAERDAGADAAAAGPDAGTAAAAEPEGEFAVTELLDWWSLSSIFAGTVREEMLGAQISVAPDRFSVQDTADAEPTVFDHPTYESIALGDTLDLFYLNGEAAPEAGSQDLSGYQQARGWRVYDQYGNDTQYSLYELDGQFSLIKWISHGRTGTITEVYYWVALSPAGADLD